MSDLDEYDDDELEEFDDEESNLLWLNDTIGIEITSELKTLTDKEFLEFCSDEFKKYKYDELSELRIVGFEFDKQYLVQWWNIREEQTIRTPTGAGNIVSLINRWLLPILNDLILDLFYGKLQEIGANELLDSSLTILIDVLDWKMERSNQTSEQA